MPTLKILTTQILLLASPVVLQNPVSYTSPRSKLSQIFFKADESKFKKKDANHAERALLRKKKVEEKNPEYLQYLESAIEGIQNYATYNETVKHRIKEKISEQWIDLPEYDEEKIKLNILEHCVYVNPKNPNQCYECVDGYGPYPVDPSTWLCKKCNVTLDNCDKCMWMQQYTPVFKIIYGCQNCTLGWYPINATRVDRRFHRGDWCTRCSSNCYDCLTETWCTKCDSSREVYLPPGALEIEAIRYCRYTMVAKLKFSGISLFIFFTFMALVQRYLCSEVKTIRKKFLISTTIEDNHVDIGELMTQEIQVVPGRNGSSSSSSSYIPRISNLKSKRLSSTSCNNPKMPFGEGNLSFKKKNKED